MSTQTVEISGQGWQLVYDAAVSGPFVGQVFVVTADFVEFRTGTSLPAAGAKGWPAQRLDVTISQLQGGKLYARSTDGQALLVMEAGTDPRAWPAGIFTSSPDAEGFGRLQVDVGETGFFEGREFRVVRKLVLAGTPITYRFVSAVDFILHEQQFAASSGDLELYVWRDSMGTPGGSFATPVLVLGKNISAEYREFGGLRYATQVAIHSGGTFTPTDAEVYADYDRAKTSNATAQQLTVGGSQNSQRYLSAGTYYLTVSGTGEGRIALAWEERPQ